MATVKEQEDSKAIVEYLQAPKRKRKQYVIIAVEETFSSECKTVIETYIRKRFPSLAIVTIHNAKEFERIWGRQIVLLVVHDKFHGLPGTLGLLKALKIKKSDKVVPILFLTENEEDLIAAYRKELLAFQEVDNYLSYRNASTSQIEERVRKSLELHQPRRSRRFETDISVRFSSLRETKHQQGKIVNISVHGGVLVGPDEASFRVRDQLQVSLPGGRYLSSEKGEFLRLAARVQRVFMGGSRAALSWEHVSESQFLSLSEFVLKLAGAQNVKGGIISVP